MNQNQAQLQQQQIFFQEVNKQIKGMVMSWDNDMREWYEYAYKALNFASPVTTGLTHEDFAKLAHVEPQGVELNRVATLCNNLESRTANEMEFYSFDDFCKVIELNSKIAKRWQQMVSPVQDKIKREINIMQANKMAVANLGNKLRRTD